MTDKTNVIQPVQYDTIPSGQLPLGQPDQLGSKDHQIHQKEKSHVVDNRRNSIRTMVAWLFRSEYKPKVSANRRLDSRSARNRHPTRCVELAGSNQHLK